MKKKTYINPVLESIELKSTNNLLAGSGGVGNGDSVGNAVKGDTDYARDYDFDFDEEE